MRSYDRPALHPSGALPPRPYCAFRFLAASVNARGGGTHRGCPHQDLSRPHVSITFAAARLPTGSTKSVDVLPGPEEPHRERLAATSSHPRRPLLHLGGGGAEGFGGDGESFLAGVVGVFVFDVDGHVRVDLGEGA